ncbi:MAG: tyrosine--tRNA ligase, partial [Patescibacteria group bacterium]
MKNLIDKILSRGVSEIIGVEELRKKLETTPEKVVIKYGIDPTRPDIHLGHAVCLRKLREFQDLGCKIVFLIGDFTAQIGDPTGKSQIRPEIDFAKVAANAQTYIEQVKGILDTKNKDRFIWLRNSDWYYSINDLVTPDNFELSISAKDQEGNEKGGMKMKLPANHYLAKAQAWNDSRQVKGATRNVSLFNIIRVLRKITHSRLIERDLFQERIKSGEPLFMHEMLYPVLQGIDSHVISEYFGK